MMAHIGRYGRFLSSVWFGRSIRHQVLLAISAMLLLASLAAGSIAVINGRNAVEVEIGASMDFAERYLRELVRRIAAEEKLSELDTLVSRDIQHLRHARVYVVDPGELPRILRPKKTLKDEVATLDQTPDWFEALMMPKGGTEHARLIPVPDGDRALILKGDPDDEIAEMWHDLSALSIVAGISIVVLLGAFYFVLGWILNPLVALARGLVALEAGERSQRLKIPRVSEIADIARKFNSLASSLDQTRAENGGLYRQIQSLQEDERREVARELHDEAGPCLFGITANAESINTLAAALGRNEGEQIRKRTAEILSITDRLKSMNRALLKRLHPVSIGKIPLPGLIRDLIYDFERRHPAVNIACSVGPFARSYGDKIDLIVYRSVQEALTNAIRHGQASNIIVELREEQGADWETRDAANVISLRISDDGIGIKSGTQAGFGLSAMRERVLSARGSLAVEGHNPQGTTISVKIPGFASEPKGLVVSEDHRVTA